MPDPAVPIQISKRAIGKQEFYATMILAAVLGVLFCLELSYLSSEALNRDDHIQELKHQIDDRDRTIQGLQQERDRLNDDVRDLRATRLPQSVGQTDDKRLGHLAISVSGRASLESGKTGWIC